MIKLFSVPPVPILNPHNIVLAQIRTRLNLYKLQRNIAGIFQSMNLSHRYNGDTRPVAAIGITDYTLAVDGQEILQKGCVEFSPGFGKLSGCIHSATL